IPEGRVWPISQQIIYRGDINVLKRILAL
ncbi:unnamed protein product, partial [Adineta steineri]